jgi:serine protease Do
MITKPETMVHADLNLLTRLALKSVLWLSPFILVLSWNQISIQAAPVASSTDVNNVQVSSSVATIAQQVTVRIFSESDAGSGVVIQRSGKTYTVLTCAHVVASDAKPTFRVLTSDGATYPAEKLPATWLKDFDLALVQFRSDRIYQVSTLGDSSTLVPGELVYAAGFPNWHIVSSNRVDGTRDWGLKAYTLVAGQFSMLLKQPLWQGYQLGYTNEVENGMSGGPVLNQQGQLIGINGRLKYPPQGIRVFVFQDSTMPSELLFQQMETLSWAIPVSAFKHLLLSRSF